MLIKFTYTLNLINKHESTGLRHLSDSIAFIEYFSDVEILNVKY